MKTKYHFSYEVNGHQIQTESFFGENEKEARKWAQCYKQREIGPNSDYPTNKIKVVYTGCTSKFPHKFSS